MQVYASCSNCLLGPAHQTDCKALLQHFVIPWSPVCNLARMSWRRDNGTTIQLRQDVMLDCQIS